MNRVTTDGKPADPSMEGKGAPQPINPATGQHKAYWVLSEDERAKGFVRPVRHSYVHVGKRPKYPLRDITPEEKQAHGPSNAFTKIEVYPEGCTIASQAWTDAQLHGGCGAMTSMSMDIAETYARDPKFYGQTFCIRCRKHLPVGEFVWDGTDEVVGS